MTRKSLIAPVCTVTALLMSGCAGGVLAATPGASTPSPTPVRASDPKPTIEPKSRPAVTAYLRFVDTLAEASRHPRKLGQRYPPTADFARYSFFPVTGQATTAILSLAEQGQVIKGVPGRPRLRVVAMAPKAKPYPKVVLRDCQTPTTHWRIYDARSGKDLTAPLPPGVPPLPYLTTAEVIYHQGHWGVSKITADTTRTCRP